MNKKDAAFVAAIALACAAAIASRAAIADGSSCGNSPSGAQSEAAQARVKVSNPGEIRSIWVTYSWDPCPHDWHLNATIWPPGTRWVSMVNKNMKKKTDVRDEPRWRFEGNSRQGDGYAHLVDTYYHRYYIGFVEKTSVPAGYLKDKNGQILYRHIHHHRSSHWKQIPSIR